MGTASFDMSVLPIVGYVFAMYMLVILVVGPRTTFFTGPERAHFSKYLLSCHEGGNVALPLYLSIVGASSNTVIFDLAGTFTCFVVMPIMIARESAKGAGAADILKSIVTSPFIIAVTLGLVLNLTGVFGLIVASPFGPAWTATLSMATSPIVALILFCLGYDLTVDKSMLAPILRLGAVRLAGRLAIILGFFLLFHTRMSDREFLMAVLIYFMCPTGFGMAPLLTPLYKSNRDASFTSAFMSLYIVVTLIAYTLVVLLVA